MRQRRLALAATLISATAALAGCSSDGTQASTTGGDKILTLVSPSEFTNLDPSPVTDTADGLVIANVYETLTRYAAPGSDPQVAPGLAQSWTHTEDGKSWTFKLRPGMKFHDGSAVDAAAVKFSIERTMKLGQGSAYIWAPVSAITAVDPLTVKFDLKYAAALDLVAAAADGSYIFSPKSATGKDGAWYNDGHDAGSGPYRIGSYTKGQQVVLRKFDGYWGGWKSGQFSTVIAKVVIDPSARQQLIQSGDADWTFQVPTENLAELKSDTSVQISDMASYQSRVILLNTQKGPLANKLVRQAVSYAFPYDQVIEQEADGYASKAFGPVPASLLPGTTSVTAYTLDLDKAKSLLAQAGYAGGFAMTVTCTAGDTLEKNTAELWQAELAKIGVTLKVQVMAWPAQWALAKGDPKKAQEAFSFYWFPAFPTPYDPLYNMFHSAKPATYNLAYYDNPAFDTLIDEANVKLATARDEAMSDFVKAQQMVVDDAGGVFAMDEHNVHITRADLKGYADNPAYPHMVFAYQLSR